MLPSYSSTEKRSVAKTKTCTFSLFLLLLLFSRELSHFLQIIFHLRIPPPLSPFNKTPNHANRKKMVVTRLRFSFFFFFFFFKTRERVKLLTGRGRERDCALYLSRHRVNRPYTVVQLPCTSCKALSHLSSLIPHINCSDSHLTLLFVQYTVPTSQDS